MPAFMIRQIRRVWYSEFIYDHLLVIFALRKPILSVKQYYGWYITRIELFVLSPYPSLFSNFVTMDLSDYGIQRVTHRIFLWTFDRESPFMQWRISQIKYKAKQVFLSLYRHVYWIWIFPEYHEIFRVIHFDLFIQYSIETGYCSITYSCVWYL